MNCRLIFQLRILALLPVLATASWSQITPVDQPVAPPVAYSSVSQLNGMLGEMEQTSQTTQLDLAKLRIEKWKADNGSKRQAQSNVESIQRNLQSALPGMISDLRTSPESLASTFKLYRNLDALYDVFSSVVESAGAFGGKDEFQTLENDLSAVEKNRRAFADRMETLAGAKEAELARLHAALKAGQTATASQQPRKTIVDDEEPVKKPVKKKPVPKPAAKAPAAAPATPSSTPAAPKAQ